MSMGELKEAKSRWSQKMPRFFKNILYVCAMVSGAALAVNTTLVTAGAQMPEWWVELFPYLIGVPAGMMFVCKFTVNGGFTEEENGNTILDKDDF